ncbi:MAG: NAD-dependent epimerase/dehydratase family protein [Proteobacteria bacterium]|nr:NAD-dependent epimerase/dehydratase family protein [Pseudomonadota bacterium]
MSTIAITGATGFIGRTLASFMKDRGWRVLGTVRASDQAGTLPDGVEPLVIGHIGSGTDWGRSLDGVDAVVHLAARAHVARDRASDPLAAFREVNVAGSERLARMAAEAGVGRMIFVSSIGVNGNYTTGAPFTEAGEPCPHDLYAVSKWEAEQALSRIGRETGLEIATLRPPLVYGPQAPGDLTARIIRMVERNLPLPLAGIKARRSYIYSKNMVEAIFTCLTHPRAAGQTYLVSDGQDVSTPEFIKHVAGAMGRSARLFPCPMALLRLAGRLAGKARTVEGLLTALEIDSSKIRMDLDWQPPYTVSVGLAETVDWYMTHERS